MLFSMPIQISSAEHACLLSLAIIFGLDSLNIILAILRGCILSLSQDAEREAFFYYYA